VDGDDLLGDGVNVAARLEQLCEPGGVLVSGTAYDHLQGRLDLPLEFTGEQQVKNIARPMRIYRVDLGDVTSPMKGPNARSHNKASIAVLPFRNISGDPEQEYFSDGITENIITELSLFRSLFVIARNSSFRYKSQSPMVQDVGRQLGVEYVVEGSVRKAGSRIRISAQLIDTRTGGHVWTERYDRPLGDTLTIQDEMTGSIAARLGAAIERAEADIGGRKSPADFGAYDFYLQGRAKSMAHSKAPQLEARELFRKAIEIDPRFAPAYAELARTYYTEIALRWDPPHQAETLAKGFELARRAVALDQTLPVAHMIMGDLFVRQHDYEEAVVWVEKAILLNPNDPDNYAALANIKTFLGKSAESLSLMRKAIDLDPNYPPIYDMYIGRAYLATRQPAAAIPHLRNCVSRMPDHWPAHFYLAAAYGHLGQLADAGAALAAARRYTKIDSIQGYAKTAAWKLGPESDYVFEGLALGGLPRG
jgi:TolB-like protein/Tfp pilus assembly protein PilF